jgi:HNH endonuclease
MHTKILFDRLRELMNYDAATGVFTWRKGRGRAAAGAIAGSPDEDGYVAIGIDGKRYRAHRLAWLYVSGQWPASDLDHEDCDKTNNRFKNLRPATFSENRCNVPLQRVNTSGYKGVHFNKHAKRWRSIIKARGASKFLGYFDTAESAHAAYCAAAKELHGTFARFA